MKHYAKFYYGTSGTLESIVCLDDIVHIEKHYKTINIIFRHTEIEREYEFPTTAEAVNVFDNLWRLMTKEW